MSDWHQVVFNIAVVTNSHGGRGSWATLRAEDRADVLWVCWKDGDGAPHARVVRGRDLNQPDLVHAAHRVDDEDQAVDFAESFGDEIPVGDDGKTLMLPEPAAPEHHVATLLSGRFKSTMGLRPADGGTKWVQATPALSA